MTAACTQVKVSVSSELAAAFKARCMSFDVSMTSEIARFMTETVSRRAAPKAVPDLSARKLRRKTVRDIVAALTKILDAEENYLSNIPENLQSGPAYAASEQTSESLSEAIECLSEAYQ